MLSLSPFSAPREEDATPKKQGSSTSRVVCGRLSRPFPRRRPKSGKNEDSGVYIEDLPSTIQTMTSDIQLNDDLSTSFTMVGGENGLGFSSDIVVLPKKPTPRIDTPLHRPKNAKVRGNM